MDQNEAKNRPFRRPGGGGRPVVLRLVSRPVLSPPDYYYRQTRPEVAALVPASARQIVDVGCAAGGLGHALKQARPGVEVRGIEPVAAQAELARQVLDDVVNGFAEDPLPESWPAPDCVIFADVLEHMVDPQRVLRRWRERMAPGGTIVVSLPNIAHRSIVLGLLKHRWDYAPEGILDATHLRFFTRETGIEMFESCGFRVHTVRRILDIGSSWLTGKLRRLFEREQARERTFGGPLGTVADLCTFQILFVAVADTEHRELAP